MILDRFRLDGKTALVTGAGQGIGKSIAVAFAEAGADVVIAARTRSALEVTAKDIEACGRRCLIVTCDINEASQQQALVDESVAAFGKIDILVTNAGDGGFPGKSLLQTSDEDIEAVFHFNVVSRIQLARMVVPHMLGSSGPSIIHITSVLGRLRERGYMTSGAANAAVGHMARNMAADLSPKIRVNAMALGSVATPTLLGFITEESTRKGLADGTLLKRIGQPEDIAAAALFLASDAASWVTGKVFEIDGGQEAISYPFDLADV